MLTLLVPQYFLFDVFPFQKYPSNVNSLYRLRIYFVLYIFRRKTAIDDIAVRPITQFPVSLAEEVSLLHGILQLLILFIVFDDSNDGNSNAKCTLRFFSLPCI